MKERNCVVGVDFGSDSVRALVVDAASGEILANAVAGYPRWKKGLYCDAERRQFRQHPLDYIEAFTACVTEVCQKPGLRDRIKAISVDTTGSTVCPTDGRGVPLALLPEFEQEPGAMFYLWKDHTATAEAAEISQAFSGAETNYTRFMGPYSSEWYWAKILHAVRNYDFIREKAEGWVEHCDYMANLLCGRTEPEKQYRCACAAGHKAYWHSTWGGLPSDACLNSLDPYLVQIKNTWVAPPEGCTQILGSITGEWAEKLGLPKTVLIVGGSFDAHAGAVGAGVCPGTMVVNIGTSAVNMLVEKAENLPEETFAHIAGCAENSIIPGYVGVETSQACYGDSFAWLKRLLLWPVRSILAQSDLISTHQKAKLAEQMENNIFSSLQKEAEHLGDEGIPLTLDWLNGRRYPCNRDDAFSVMEGINISAGAPELYRSLVEAAAFGQRLLFEQLRLRNIRIERIVAVGGIAQKSAYAMQVLCDALQFPVSISPVEQACAFGAAIYAATAFGAHPDIVSAQKAMCRPCVKTYIPDKSRAAYYDRRFAEYLALAAKTDPAMKPFVK